MIDPGTIRAKASTFDTGLRGYHLDDVAAYLGRIALAMEVLGEPGPRPALPPGFTPAAIRQQEFEVVWRGCNPEEVRAYLDELADELQRRLDQPPPEKPIPTLSLPRAFGSYAASTAQASGVLVGAEIITGTTRRPVTFFTPEGLTADLSSRLVAAETCLVSNVIIVSEITVETMTAAVDHLASSGEL